MKNTKSRASGVSPAMRELSAYMAAAADKALPAEVAEKTRHHILDSVAAMISGAQLPPGKIAASFARREGGPPEACIAGTRIVVAAVNAALANGMTAHADETDDSHQPAFYHPGCAVIPAAFAVAERERAPGSTLMRAVALGYDVGTRVNLALGAMKFHLAGHSSHSFGALFAAAAAAGALSRLEPDRMRYLLSYTVQQASGVSCWMRDPDHIEKAFDLGGMAARNAVHAASMVAHGMSGVEDVFSGERNFLFAFGAEGNAHLLTAGLGRNYEIMRANIKKWSVGSPIQAPLDSLEALIAEHKFRTADVERVRIQVQDQEAPVVDNRDMPDICLQHMAAIMLLDGTVSFVSSHEARRMKDRKVLDLRSRIEFTGSPELTKAGGRQAIVEIDLRGGHTLKHHTRAVKGTADNPMTSDEVRAKCFDLIAPTLGKTRTRKLMDAVWKLDEVADMRELRPLLQA